MSYSFDVKAAVEAGRRCIGVPFEHQGRNPETGLDCAGLVLVMLEAGGWKPLHPEITLVENYDRIGSWRDINKVLKSEGFEIRRESVRPMDLLLIHWTETPIPQHFATVTEVNKNGIYIIHTHQTFGDVREHRVDSEMWEQVHCAWRFYRGTSEVEEVNDNQLT